MKKVLLTIVMSLVMCMGMFAQGYAWKMSPKPTEKVVGKISMEHDGGFLSRFDTQSNRGIIENDHREYLSDTEMYESLLKKAKDEYGKLYPRLELRSFVSSYKDTRGGTERLINYYRTYYSSATIVTPDATIETNDNLPEVVGKALRNVPVGSRLAIDQIIVTIDMDGEMLKDKLVDMLLDKGYRVVAKEYLEKLYKEQQDQLNSGLYNPDTTVEGSKFSAVGYFINLKVTKSSLRVQVVNVSTGEYEGNATVNF